MKNYRAKVKIQNKVGKEIETHIGNDNKVWFVRCSCTGNTKQDSTQMYYNHTKQVVYCPHCHKEITPTKTCKEYEEEARKKEEQKPLCLIQAAYDWETGITYYKLNKTIPTEDWNKVKQYFYKFTENDTFYTDMQGEKGWMTRNPQEVEEILGITETTTKQEKEATERRQQYNQEMKQKQIQQEAIQEMFKYSKPCDHGTKLTDLEKEATQILEDPENPWNIYGGGRKWIITKDKIYQITNNGHDGDNWKLNNIQTGGAGAIGIYIPHEKHNESIIIKYGV